MPHVVRACTPSVAGCDRAPHKGELATSGFLWLQILYLMFVAVVPIANTMNSLYAGSFAVHAAYAANIFFIGVFSYFTWDYSTRGHRLVDPDLDRTTIDGLRHEALVEPSVALLSIPAAAFSAAAGELLFLLIPVVFLVQKRRRKKRAQSAD